MIPDPVLRTALESVTGEQALLSKDVGWALKTPCADCPFTKAAPFHGGVASSLKSYGESIDLGTFAHTCHQTDPRKSCDGPRPQHGKPQHCIGSIIMLLKTGNGMDLQRDLLYAAEQGKCDIHELTAIAKADTRCFTWKEMLGFYLKEISRRLTNHKRAERRAAAKARRQ